MASLEDKEYDADALDWLTEQFGAPIIIPAHHSERTRDEWMRMGEALMEASNAGGAPHASVTAWTKIANAYRQGRVADFNTAVFERQPGIDVAHVFQFRHDYVLPRLRLNHPGRQIDPGRSVANPNDVVRGRVHQLGKQAFGLDKSFHT